MALLPTLLLLFCTLSSTIYAYDIGQLRSPFGSFQWRRELVARRQNFKASGMFDPVIDSVFIQWEAYKRKFDKSYLEDEHEHLQAFVLNSLKVEEHNKRFREGNETFEMELNHLADWTPAEYKRINGFRVSQLKRRNTVFDKTKYQIKLPDTVDYTFLIPWIKDQGQCGSCYIFSAVGSVEAHHAMQTTEQVRYSEQNVLDCNGANSGCDGGWMDDVFEYVKDNGIDPESDYPYEGRVDQCRFNPNNALRISGYVDLPKGDEEALMTALATVGPITVAIDASHNSFQMYKSGIYDEPACNPDGLDHAVIAMGYGNENGQDYWLIKNSWGAGWGINGYIKMKRGGNQCGVATAASYPTM